MNSALEPEPGAAASFAALRHVRVEGERLALLLRLADPEAATPKDGIAPAERVVLCDVARLHGVLPIVWRHLRRMQGGAGLLDAYRELVTLQTGRSMQLEQHALRIDAAFTAAGVAAAPVKGPVFAARLYPYAADRPFTDIDLLIAPGHMPRAAAAMRELGYDLAEKALFDNAERNQEYKWTFPGDAGILIELHGDMVHYPGLRRRVSFGYDQLLQAGAGDGKAPLALMMTAVVHAAFGHKFHRLHFVVDLLQAFRRLSDDEIGRLGAVAAGLGLKLELSTALDLADRLFGAPRAGIAARAVDDGMAARVARRLLTASVVVNATAEQGFESWLARRSFRLLQLAVSGR